MSLKLESVLLRQRSRAVNGGTEATRGDAAILTNLFDEFGQIIDLGNRYHVQFGSILLGNGECEVERMERRA